MRLLSFLLYIAYLKTICNNKNQPISGPSKKYWQLVSRKYENHHQWRTAIVIFYFSIGNIGIVNCEINKISPGNYLHLYGKLFYINIYVKWWWNLFMQYVTPLNLLFPCAHRKRLRKTQFNNKLYTATELLFCGRS